MYCRNGRSPPCQVLAALPKAQVGRQAESIQAQRKGEDQGYDADGETEFYRGHDQCDRAGLPVRSASQYPVSDILLLKTGVL